MMKLTGSDDEREGEGGKGRKEEGREGEREGRVGEE